MDNTKFEKVKEIVEGMLNVGPEKVTPEARLEEDLGADETDRMEILGCLEEEYGIEISDEQILGAKTVADLVKLVETLSSETQSE